MKKLLVVLLAAFLIGQMSRENWDKATPETQKSFLETLAGDFALKINCVEGKLVGITDGKMVYFYFDCTKFKGGQEI